MLHAMSGTELSRVRTELRLLPPKPINQRLLESRAADIVMQSSAVLVRRRNFKICRGSSDGCRVTCLWPDRLVHYLHFEIDFNPEDS